ncbi:hypothetical protein EVAR_11588_1 [Eumeta japonica]|uniref:Uncharacterized protein n=1 Tax=Eumeta variegata TaxID=151549 RepID=A0A4C1X3K7_EUMVA|nr:hypothetical protein EVAR_11588_1 [Eumeta japonica]
MQHILRANEQKNRHRVDGHRRPWTLPAPEESLEPCRSLGWKYRCNGEAFRLMEGEKGEDRRMLGNIVKYTLRAFILRTLELCMFSHGLDLVSLCRTHRISITTLAVLVRLLAHSPASGITDRRPL